MEVTSLNYTNALSTYSDVWIVPPYNESKWSKLIDYYLNFMILKSQNRKSMQINDKLKSILIKEEISSPSIILKNKSPLMIAAQKCLPAKQLVFLDTISSLGEYVDTVNEICQKLGSRSIKIFTPQNISTDDLRKKLNTQSHTVVYLVEPTT